MQSSTPSSPSTARIPEADRFVVVAHGTLDDVTTAKRILERTGAPSIDEHRVPGAA